MNNKKVLFTLVFIVFFIPCISFAADAKKNSTDGEDLGIARYAIYVGSNEGGENTQRLLYAETDAISFQKTMTEIGGIPGSNGILLLDPSKEDLDNAMQTVSYMINKNKKQVKRSEFIFYYSGHSDENALLLGRNKYGYSELKAAISNVPSDVHVVILDSCYSGNFIRTKGGQKKKPFLVDDSSVVKGHAYLSSSSSQEYAQESSEIGSSFFTNALLTGLRGAADSSGDKKITLNELYSYAFNETLSKTENSSVGPQHPNYNITLVGSGDLVLSDISNSDCIVMLSSELRGRVLIRYKNGKLASEINKVSGNPVYLALEKGEYSATLIEDTETLQGNFTVTSGKVYELTDRAFSPVSTSKNRLRGDEKNAQNEIAFNLSQEEMYVPFEFSFLMNEFSRKEHKRIVTPFSLSILHSKVYKSTGAMVSIGVNNAYDVSYAQVAGIGNIAHNFHGIQSSGIFNLANDFDMGIQVSGIVNKANNITGIQGSGIVNVAQDVKGVQGSGIVNTAKDVKGVQGAGIVNVADDVEGVQISWIVNKANDVKGAQLGLVNIADEVHGIQFGLINICKDGVLELGTSFTSNRNVRFTFNTGKRFLYGIIGGSLSGKCMFDSYDGKKQFNFIYGLGTRAKLGMFNFDFEIIRIVKNECEDEDEDDYYVGFDTVFVPTLRLSAGITPVKHINIFAGCSFSSDYGESGDVFENLEKNLTIHCNDDFKIYPEFDLGIRYSFN